MINYHVGDLFALAPVEAWLVQACNTQGSWGKGIAAEFAKRYPEALKAERSLIKHGNLHSGQCWVYPNHPSPGSVVCLYTSEGYGRNRDSEHDILVNTAAGLEDLYEMWLDNGKNPIWAPKFNSGLFGVPWGKTEAFINAVFGSDVGAWNIVSLK